MRVPKGTDSSVAVEDIPRRVARSAPRGGPDGTSNVDSPRRHARQCAGTTNIAYWVKTTMPIQPIAARCTIEKCQTAADVITQIIWGQKAWSGPRWMYAAVAVEHIHISDVVKRKDT